MTSTQGPPFSLGYFIVEGAERGRGGKKSIKEFLKIDCLSAQTGFKIFTYVQSPLAQPRVFAIMTS